MRSRSWRSPWAPCGLRTRAFLLATVEIHTASFRKTTAECDQLITLALVPLMLTQRIARRTEPTSKAPCFQEDQLLRKRLQDLEAKQSGSPLPESELESRESSPKKDNKEKLREDKKTKSKDKGGSTTTAESSGLLDTIGAFLGVREETKTMTPTTKASPAGPHRWRTDMQCGKNVAGPDGKPAATCNPESEMPCCGVSGWCGNLDAHCTCNGCVNYRPYSQTRPKRIALIAPFRDREAHLQRFRDRIDSHVDAWNQKGIRHDWTVYVVEQFDNDLFNRGYLFNVGFRNAMEHAKRSGKPYDCVVMHDIDILPEAVVDYGWCLRPSQLSGEIECWSW